MLSVCNMPQRWGLEFFGLGVECKNLGSLSLFQTLLKRKLNSDFSE